MAGKFRILKTVSLTSVCVLSGLLTGAFAHAKVNANAKAVQINTPDTKHVIQQFLDFQSDKYKTIAKAVVTMGGQSFYQWQQPTEFVYDKKQGRHHRPNSVIRHIQRTDTELVFDATYSFDSFGRRKNILPRKASQQRFLILFGCSFTYGNGLNDDETLNYHIARQSEQYYPYNYAIGASGTNALLSLVEKTDFKTQVSESTGDFVYVYLPISHVARATGRHPSLRFLQFDPWFKQKDDGSLVQAGLFRDRVWQNRFYKLLGWFAETVRGQPNRIVPPLGEDDYLTVCQMIAQAKRRFLQQYPNSRFLVYAHPIAGAIESPLQQCLAEKGVDFLNGKNLTGDFTIANDGHPNSRANRAVAKEILQYLDLGP